MVRPFAIVLAALCIVPVWAGEQVVVQRGDSPSFAVPVGSPVVFVSMDQAHVAHFAGRFVVSGAYYFGPMAGRAGPMRPGRQPPVLVFEPDNAVALPYRADGGPVRYVRISNARAFVEAAIPAAVLEAVRGGTVESTSGRATFLASDYQARVECDQAYYETTFIALTAPPTTEMAQRAAPESRC